MEIVTYKYAKEHGLVKYFTGSLCKRGHLAERITSSRQCVACAKIVVKEWEVNNKQRLQDYRSEWYKANKNKAIKQAKTWRVQNTDAANASVSKWRAKNSIKYKAYMAKAAMQRYVAKQQRAPKWADNIRIQAYYDVCAFFNDINGFIKYHVDHVIPLRGASVSGLHVHNNLQIILASENLAKGNRATHIV